MSLKSCRSPCMWHCHHAAERDARFYPTRDLATQFDRFESNGLQHLGYPSREGLLFADPWCKELKERLLRELRLLDHTIITAAIVQWRSGLNACVCMNSGHFEHKFWASDLTAVYRFCFINTGFRKCDRYKHVHSTTGNIVWNVLFLCLDTFTRCGSNITCGRKFLCQWLCHLWRSCARKKYENPSIFVKVTAKQSGHFFYVDTLYILRFPEPVLCRFQLSNVKILHKFAEVCVKSMIFKLTPRRRERHINICTYFVFETRIFPQWSVRKDLDAAHVDVKFV